MANSIAKKLGHLTGKEVRSYFLHVKGPELLNKYVGESERQVREVFKKAKERAADGHPVIVFFDEMDALFRTRGTGISSDIESTIVPQFLSEIDGVERLAQRHRHRREQSAGSHRSGRAPCRPVGCQGEGRPSRCGGRARKFSRSMWQRICRSPRKN